jgi:oligoribonuclease
VRSLDLQQSPKEAEMLLWIDTETTGLDPEKCKLLEVALVVTTNELDVCWEHSWVLPHPIETRDEAVEYVQKMHDTNGLWKDCEGEYARAIALYNPADPQTHFTKGVESEILREMRKWTEAGSTPICGSTIAFDRRFLEVNMPSVAAHFSYRNLDVSVFTELSCRWAPEVYKARPQGGGHRALPDIKVSIEMLRYWRKEMIK